MPNLWDARFDRLHACQTRQLGIDIRATIPGHCTSARAILGTVNANSMIYGGGVAESEGFEIQIKVSDCSSEPVKQLACTVNGAATGKDLEVGGPITNTGAVYQIPLVDYAAKS